MAQQQKNILFYGDNLAILREYVDDESVDLIYLDPPFNSQRTYNVLFKDESGQESEAQLAAFDDTWHWDDAAEATYHELVTESPVAVSKMIGALREFVGTNQMMAYLVMMAIRLVDLHRVLKPTGSLYLHCDPTASHYLKVILDTIFGPENFRNEITWKRSSAHSDAKQGRKAYGNIADIIFFYSKTQEFTFNTQHTAYSEEYINSFYKYVDPDGRRYRLGDLTGPGGAAKGNPAYEVMGVTRYWRYSKEKMAQLIAEGRVVQTKPGNVPQYKRYLDEMPGVPLQNIWDDIPPIGAQAAERLGYPTQKPLTLLERIVKVSSNPGDVVLDPFCGCGTTVAAAEKLERQWLGIDITHLSIALQKYRLQEMFPEAVFEVTGEPESVRAAEYLAKQDRFQFEWWALSLVKARPGQAPTGSKKGKKGADRGIDGVINFIDSSKGKPQRVLVQVKSGKVSSRDIRDLVGTVEREKGVIGVLITLEPPSKPMKTEALSAGYYESPVWKKKYPKIQILTIEELLNGVEIDMPPAWGTFKQAQKMEKDDSSQQQMSLL